MVSGAVEREQVSCCYSVEIIFQCQKIKKSPRDMFYYNVHIVSITVHLNC